MYEEIKQNIIKNFFNKNYKWACCIDKSTIIEDIKNRSTFPITVLSSHSNNENENILNISLGNNIAINICLVWETYTYTNKFNKSISQYRLIDIK